MSRQGTVLGIARNPLTSNVPDALVAASRRLAVQYREIDLGSIAVDVDTRTVRDRFGEIVVTHIAPVLFYWAEVAIVAVDILESRGVSAINGVRASELADDKARTAGVLAEHGVAQLPTIIVPDSREMFTEACIQMGLPCVAKRSHGAQGRWVRRVDDRAEINSVFDEFIAEGPTSLIVQELATDFIGRSIRVLVLAGEVIGATLRTGAPGSFVSNIGAGGSQEVVTLSDEEIRLAVSATTVLGLGFAGVDLCRHNGCSYVLEVNSCPDFTSMIPLLGEGIADQVVLATLDERRAPLTA